MLQVFRIIRVLSVLLQKRQAVTVSSLHNKESASGTVVLTEYASGKEAKETALDKLKRLILNDPDLTNSKAS